jgi:crossover junction endodeoxyribonuclease RuvC
MRYVGIDPSTKTGLVVTDGKDTWAKEITSKEEQDPQRFFDITEQILDWLNEGDIITIEGFSYGSRGRGVSTQYGLGWIIRAELIKNGYSYIEVSPSAVKKFATGKGNASKDAMAVPIYKKWSFEHDSDNVRDAYVLAQIAKALHEEEGLTTYQKEVMKKIQEGK